VERQPLTEGAIRKPLNRRRPICLPAPGRLPIAWALLPLLALTACVPAPPRPTATATSLPPTLTATFPFPTLKPTATELGAATQTPAPGPLDQAGDLRYQADFSEPDGWPLGQDSMGAVSLIGGSLSVVLPRAGLARAIRSPAPPQADFILDVQVHTELCQGDDEYGLLFRQTSDDDYLRFTLTCRGGIRLRRVRDGSPRALVPFDDRNPAVTPGAPADNRVTLRALGPELAFYVNGAPVMVANDPLPHAGFFGVFVASSSKSSQTTVLFDHWSLYDWQEGTATDSRSPDGEKTVP
jgi:hypothetical protein